MEGMREPEPLRFRMPDGNLLGLPLTPEQESEIEATREKYIKSFFNGSSETNDPSRPESRSAEAAPE